MYEWINKCVLCVKYGSNCNRCCDIKNTTRQDMQVLETLTHLLFFTVFAQRLCSFHGCITKIAINYCLSQLFVLKHPKCSPQVCLISYSTQLRITPWTALLFIWLILFVFTGTSPSKGINWRWVHHAPRQLLPTLCPGGRRASNTGKMKCLWMSLSLSTYW